MDGVDIAQLEQHIELRDARYPPRLARRLGSDAPATLYLLGDACALGGIHLGLICSVCCPGSIVIKALDAVREARDSGVVMAGGFHSPMERECLHFLLRGSQPTILSPAIGLTSLPMEREEAAALDEGRLVLLSMFDDRVTATTPTQACQRNDLVAALADVLLVAHASPGGRAELAARRALARSQRVITLDDDANQHLVALGAIRVSVRGIVRVALGAQP